MLRIKDKVSLDELRVFGFVYDANSFKYKQKSILPSICVLDDKHWGAVNRTICNVWGDADLDILFDLMKSGLVEKFNPKKKGE